MYTYAPIHQTVHIMGRFLYTNYTSIELGEKHTVKSILSLIAWSSLPRANCVMVAIEVQVEGTEGKI